MHLRFQCTPLRSRLVTPFIFGAHHCQRDSWILARRRLAYSDRSLRGCLSLSYCVRVLGTSLERQLTVPVSRSVLPAPHLAVVCGFSLTDI